MQRPFAFPAQATGWLRPAGRVLLAAVIAGVFAAPAAGPASGQTPATTWKVQVGGNGEAPNHSIDLMLPSSLTIRVGDTVNFVRNTPGAPHTVTFLGGAKAPELFIPVPGAPVGAMQGNPAALAPTSDTTYDGNGVRNSGGMGLDPRISDTYSLQFTAPGRYEYACLLHDVQKGVIVVVPSGDSLPMVTQGEVDAAAQRELAAARVELTGKVRAAAGQYPQPAPGGWVFGIDVDSKVGNAAQYFPAAQRINVGDTITWKNNSSYEIHSVTFLAGAPLPEFIFPGGLVNPEAAAPAGGATHSGGRNNSGILGPGAAYALTFTKAGTYPYICVVHEDLHTGVITVGDASAPAPAPGQPAAPAASGIEEFLRRLLGR